MEDFKALCKWTDDITMTHVIEILQDLEFSKEEIKKELNLTEKEFNKILSKTVDKEK